MLKQTTFLFVFILLFSLTVFSQSKLPNGGLQEQIDLRKGDATLSNIADFDGTYQFILSKKVDIAFTDEIYLTIKNNRKENEDVTLFLNDFCSVFIPSLRKISDINFVPFEKSFLIK